MQDYQIEILDRLLKEKGLNQSDLAECLGRNASAVTLLYSRRRQLKFEELEPIAKMLGMSIVELTSHLTGQAMEPWDDGVFAMAIQRARQALNQSSATLEDTKFADYVFELYKLGLSEKRSDGHPVITLSSAAFMLRHKLTPIN